MVVKDSRVLVTGAGGFVGSHLVERLVREGSRVTAFVHYNSRNDWGLLEYLHPEVLAQVRVVSGDLRDPHSVAAALRDQEVVFHLGALIGIPYSYVAPEAYVATNVTGTLNVLEAVRTFGVRRMVHTSTSEVYGTARYTPIDESHPLQGQSPYSASKIAADKLVESYVLSFGVPAVTLRPFNTFGPRQSDRAVIPSIISQALASDQVRLGSTDPVRDYTFVTDIVEAFLKIAESDVEPGEVVNAGSGTGLTIGEIAQRILAVLGRDLPVVLDPARVRPERSEVMVLIADASRARQLMGWTPQVSLEQGVQQTIEFIRDQTHRYKVGQYAI